MKEPGVFALAALDSLPVHIALLDKDGRIVAVNKAWESFAEANSADPGKLSEGTNYLSVCDAVTGGDSLAAKAMADGIRRLFSGENAVVEVEYPCDSPNEEFWFVGVATPFEFDGERFVSVTHKNITERKRMESYSEMGREILRILNEPVEFEKCIARILPVMKERMGFDAVGIRLRSGDDFPYYVQNGFPADFLLTENSLAVRKADQGICRKVDGSPCLECTCGMVLMAGKEIKNPFLTQGGSFWTNDSRPILDLPSDQDLRENPRNECIHRGYSSVALIPIKTSDATVGLMQFNDRRKGCFSGPTIQVLEGIAAQIGTALMRKRSEQELLEAHEENKRLFHELQHRAKNSFNMISGMISYAASTDISIETKSVLDELSDRVTAVSRLYSLLYESGTFERLSLDRYCESVASPLVGLHPNLTLVFDMESVLIRAKIAGAIGLIVTELVTNAIKYAFPGKAPGTITIKLRKSPAGASLWIRDDGIGLSEGFDPDSNPGMGLNLVKGLTAQIEGTFAMKRLDKGTLCTVDFKVEG